MWDNLSEDIVLTLLNEFSASVFNLSFQIVTSRAMLLWLEWFHMLLPQTRIFIFRSFGSSRIMDFFSAVMSFKSPVPGRYPSSSRAP